MANQRLADCHRTEKSPLERVNYFRRQRLTEADMTTDQDYFRQKLRRHNRFLHGWGIVCGLEVVSVEGMSLCVEIQPGYSLGPYGDEIFVADPVRLELATCGGEAMTDPCEPGRIRGTPPRAGRQTVYVAIRYAECLARPVRAIPPGCGCEEEVCEYSRIRDSFEIACLDQLPVSHLPGEPMQFCELLETRQIIPCPSCPEDPWVVLATITLPAPDGEISTEGISYMDRRHLLSTAMLQEWLYACCCIEAPLPAPTNLSCGTMGTVAVGELPVCSNMLRWNYNSGQASEFIIYRSIDRRTWQEIDRVVGATNIYTDDNDVDCGTTYHYRIRAFRDGRESGDSNISVCAREAVRHPRLVAESNCTDDLSQIEITIINMGDGEAEATTTRVSFSSSGDSEREITPLLAPSETYEFTLDIPDDAWWNNRCEYSVTVDAEGVIGAETTLFEFHCMGLI